MIRASDVINDAGGTDAFVSALTYLYAQPFMVSDALVFFETLSVLDRESVYDAANALYRARQARLASKGGQ